jgi:hypothetical protein
MNTTLNQNKWWHRLAKVIFWTSSVAVFFVATSINWIDNKPYSYVNVDEERSYIQCKKDKEKGLIYTFSKNSLYADTLNYNDLATFSKVRAQELCSQLTNEQKLRFSREETRLIEGGVWNFDERQALLATFKEKLVGDSSYTTYIEKETVKRGGYLSMIKIELLIIIALLVCMYLISSIFNYIVFGRRFVIPSILKRFLR